MPMNCSERNCTGMVNKSIILQPHLFIETDVFAQDQKIPHTEYTMELLIAEKRCLTIINLY